MAKETIETLYVASGNHKAFIKSLTEEQKKYTVTTKKADKASKGLNDQFKTMKNVVAGLAVFSIAKRALGGVAKETIRFEKELSNVKALLKPTASEFKLLSEKARELGKTTAFSAMQSAEAFAELGKLGFKANQIMASSADVLNLAAAANTEMGTAAEVTAKTLNQFSLAAEEAGRVTDVIAKASSSSAIDIFNFKEAMKIAGGVASGFGVSLEETTGAISALADAGLEGTMAGTGVSRMLSEMAKSGSKASKLIKSLNIENGTLTEKLQALKDAGLSTTDIFHAFGEEAGKSAIALINNAEKVDRLTKAYEGANGAAKEMADVQLDNLDGSLKLLKSASSELALTLGAMFSPALRAGVDLVTAGINQLSKAMNFGGADKVVEAQLARLGAVEQAVKKAEELRIAVASGDEESAKGLKSWISQLLGANGDYLKLLSELKIEKQNYGKTETELVKVLHAKLDTLKKNIAEEEYQADLAAVLTEMADKETEANRKKNEETKKEIALARQKKEALILGADAFKKIEEEGFTAAERHYKQRIKAAEDEEEATKAKIEGGKALTTALLSEEEQRKQGITDKWKTLISDAKATGQQRVDAERMMREEIKAVDDEYDAIDTENRIKLEEEEKDSLLRRIDNARMFANTVNSIVQSVFQIKENKLRATTAAEIKAVKNSTKSEEEKAKEIEKIENRAAKASHELKLKEWRASLLMSVANTALGVTKTMATMGYPVGIPFAVAVAATGAASTGVIASNKPRLALGSVNSFGESSEIGNRSGIGGVDSQVIRVSPEEMIIKPKDTAVVKDALNNKASKSTPLTPQSVVNNHYTIQATSLDPRAVSEMILDGLYEANENNMIDSTRLNVGVV